MVLGFKWRRCFRVKDVRILSDEAFLPKIEVPTRWIKSIPIKVNVFAWKLFPDRLPTRSNLARRNVLIPSLACPLCDHALEDSFHLFCDNYDSKSSSEVYLMDLRGNVVCTILRKKLLRFGLWDCYNDKDTRKPWFKVGKTFDLFKHDSVYDVVGGTNESQSIISSSNHNLEFKIIDSKGKIAAAVQRKRSSSGVVLGDDV
nr:protein LURP-one-related 4-like [Tanacetum cinerariifolium]